jgi:hypothetical protein
MPQGLSLPSGSSSAKPKIYPCASQKPTPAAITGRISEAAIIVRLGNVIPRWDPTSRQTMNYAVLEKPKVGAHISSSY